MTYSSSELTAKERSDFASDYPILIGNNVFDHKHLFSAKWGATANSAGGDATNSSYPIYNVTGRDAVALSKDTVTGANHYAHFDPVGAFSITTCDTTTGSADVDFDYNSSQYLYLQVGMTVVDDGSSSIIPRGAKIVSITPGNAGLGSAITLDKDATATATNKTLTFHGKPGATKAEFDNLLIFNHNIHSGVGGLANNIYPRLLLRDYQTEAGVDLDITTPNILTPTSGEPIVFLNLHKFTNTNAIARRYSGVEYTTLALNSSGGNTTGVAVGCVWAGKRWQLPHWPKQPYNDKSLESHSVDFDSASGTQIRHSTWQGRARRDWIIPLSHTADVDGCLEFQEDTHNFTKPFILIENPNSDPKPYIMTADTAVMSFPKTNVNERVFRISMIEKAPFYSGY